MRTPHLTRLCLVRHGETSWNAEHRVQGQLDVPLNAVQVVMGDTALTLNQGGASGSTASTARESTSGK